MDSIRESYDAAASDYASHLGEELEGKQLDREWLERFAERLRSAGSVCDLGCGPGHIAGYLRAAGLEMRGVDLSPAMVAEASRLNPEIPFQVGDLLALDMESGSLAGIVAFYAIVHLTLDEVGRAFREMYRVMQPDGLLLLSFHVGDELVHRDELWGHAVDLDFRFFQSGVIRNALVEAGFEIEEALEREPYAEVEYPSRRGYMLAKRLSLRTE